jgi:hypothetical protein
MISSYVDRQELVIQIQQKTQLFRTRKMPYDWEI